MDFLELLNPSQRAAVEYNEGPHLVIAGAGSGKTRVLTFKVAYLLQQGIPADKILALTFTNKAAREMKSRIVELVGAETARYLWMGTFHSMCARILRQEADAIGYTHDFSIYDNADSKAVIKHVLQDMQLDDKVYKISNLLARISKAKNQMLSPNEYAANRDYLMQDRFDHIPEMARIYTEYNRRLKAANAMDFDDLLYQANVLFRRHEEVLSKYQQTFQYILVDEYQDTNSCQYMLVKRLAEPENHICVVGDDAQSIYSFRGANIENILKFQKSYENAQLFKLERNYRSTQTIVNAANSLIRRNKGQIPKQVYSERPIGERVLLSSYMTDRDEAKAVATQIKAVMKSWQTISNEMLTYDDIAVLYRTNAQSRVIEDELRSKQIPYRIYGGTSFYQRKEIKDALGYFRLAANTLDAEALWRVINVPTRGIGDTTIQKIHDVARAAQVNPFDVVANPEAYNLDVAASTAQKLKDFASKVLGWMAEVNVKDAYTFASDVLQQSGLMADAKQDTSVDGINRMENLQEMLNGIHEFVDQQSQEGESITTMTDFLAEVSLLTDQDEHLDDHSTRVSLMTVHAAKGLEYKVVIIVGLEENLFPSPYSQSPKEIEEERRLLYVAITRAKELCCLMSARQRFRNGQTSITSISRFVKDIDPNFIRNIDAEVGYKPHPTTSFLDEPQTPLIHTGSQNLKRTTGIQEKSGRKACRSEWSQGDRVRHNVFGAGTVQDVYRENDNDKIEILFDAVGRKTLLLTYAKLERE